MQKLLVIRNTFFVALTLFLFSDFSTLYRYQIADSVNFAWYNVIQQGVSLFVFIAAYAYLVNMALNLQSLFRRNGLVTGYSGEIFLCVMCVFKFIDMLITEAEPVIIFLVYTNENFVCEDTLR